MCLMCAPQKIKIVSGCSSSIIQHPSIMGACLDEQSLIYVFDMWRVVNFSEKKKHAVSPHDLKNFGISILSSKFKEFFKSYKHHYPLPNFKNYIDFEKILILLTYKRHIFEIFKISKKHFFLHFWLVLQVNLNVFLIGYKFCQILCATCPKIKIFI